MRSKSAGTWGFETRERHRGLVKNGVKIAPEVSPEWETARGHFIAYDAKRREIRARVQFSA